MQFQQLTRTIKLFMILFLGYSMGGCTSGPKILSDYDPGAPFESYTTYNFMEGAGPDCSTYQSFFSIYVIEVVTIEMEKRGYCLSMAGS